MQKRRPRYKGTHPRRFEDKYKEQNPEVYSEDAKKILAKRGTLAGSHSPIMLDEIIDFLKPESGMLALDATLGYGGHSQVLLEKLSPEGTLVAIDQDPIERPKTEKRLRARADLETKLIIGALNFRESSQFLSKINIPKVDIVMADLGLSSMQIDDPKRGFSFKTESTFDLRMNPETGRPAFEVLNRISENELRQILVENADEPHARQIAAALKKQKLKTTNEVAEVVRKVVADFSPAIRKKEGDTPIRRVFQALRIVVNDEYAALEEFLLSLPDILKSSGRVGILSFHSGEDRRVKKSFQHFSRTGIYKEISKEAIRPSSAEQFRNSRSKSAKFRWAIRA